MRVLQRMFQSSLRPSARARAGWYLERLQSMSVGEIEHRTHGRLLIEAEKHGLLQSKQGLQTAAAVEGWSRFRTESDAAFFFSADDRDQITLEHAKRFPTERSATMQSAANFLQHRLPIFGREFELGPQIAWRRDPLHGRDWPDLYWADIDIRDGRTIGGVKWVWEINRHHHLVTLAKAYFLSGEERYAEEVCLQLMNWIRMNPPRHGVNWTSSLELAIRLINWTWSLAFIRQSDALTEERFRLIQGSIDEQAGHISRHLSTYSSANNHLMGEAAGLAIAGLSFPWLADAPRWRDTGLGLLRRELDLQIYPDGVSAEQSTGYLVFQLDLNLFAWRMAELNHLAVPDIWYQRFSAACEFMRHLMDSKGNVSAIGDGDDAWVVRLDDRPDVDKYRSLLATAAAIFKNPADKSGAQAWDEKSYWLLGSAGSRQFDSLPVKAIELCTRIFGAGGYTVLRDRDRVAVFDCGPLGYLTTAAHGHADALSLMLSVDGHPLLVDPGTYAYQEGYQWRDYFRSTAAHNTVVVDGLNQSEALGTFLWGRKANVRLVRQQSTDHVDLVTAQHDGYAARGILHRRTVALVKPDLMLVVDDLLGRGRHSFEQMWHFAPGMHVEIGPEGATVFLEGVVVARMRCRYEDLHGRSANSRPELARGWISPHYGRLVSAPVVRVAGPGTAPVRLITEVLFNPGCGDEAQDDIERILDLLDDGPGNRRVPDRG